MSSLNLSRFISIKNPKVWLNRYAYNIKINLCFNLKKNIIIIKLLFNKIMIKKLCTIVVLKININFIWKLLKLSIYFVKFNRNSK